VIQTCRHPLRNLVAQPAHAGLLLLRYLQTAADQGDGKRNLLHQAIEAARRARDVYELAYRRWEAETKDLPANTVTVRGRLVIGLGAESVLETGLTLHHTYGVPILPGSALKGLTAHYCDRVWGQADPGFKATAEHHRDLFGVTEDSGHIIFHDGWITPESLGSPNQGLVLDVITPHHGDYYMATENDDASPPRDFDDPVPVPFLSVAGKFRVAVRCDVAGEAGAKWARLALKLLLEALAHWGLGGKTSSGYGRFHVGS